MIGASVVICRTPGQVINAPTGLNGTLRCPKNFDNFCKNKKTCPYHCNKNGACVDGKCLCTGATQLSSSCIDVSIFVAPVGLTGGLLNSMSDNSNGLTIINGVITFQNTVNPTFKLKQLKQYSMNLKCMQGTIFDKIFGECLPCKDVYSCSNCN